MALKVNASVDAKKLDQITEQLKIKIEKEKPKIWQRSAVLVKQRILENPVLFVEPVVKILQDMQGEYYDGGYSQGDKAHFDYRGTIEMEVKSNLAETLKVTVGPGGNVEWNAVIVSEEFVGLGGNSIVGEPTKRGKVNTLPWIAFFLAGSIDEKLVWISQEVASKLKWETEHMGRFGTGFLARLDRKLSVSLKANGLNPNTLIHPVSGESGKEWFAGLHEKISQDPKFWFVYVKPAVNQATKEVIKEFISKQTK